MLHIENIAQTTKLVRLLGQNLESQGVMGRELTSCIVNSSGKNHLSFSSNHKAISSHSSKWRALPTISRCFFYPSKERCIHNFQLPFMSKPIVFHIENIAQTTKLGCSAKISNHKMSWGENMTSCTSSKTWQKRTAVIFPLRFF